MRLIYITGVFLFWATPALAYIGPGLGAGSIGLILGLLGSIFLAVVGIFYYPLKRFFKNRKKIAADQKNSVQSNSLDTDQTQDEDG